jgi:hypothetical protein
MIFVNNNIVFSRIFVPHVVLLFVSTLNTLELWPAISTAGPLKLVWLSVDIQWEQGDVGKIIRMLTKKDITKIIHLEIHHLLKKMKIYSGTINFTVIGQMCARFVRGIRLNKTGTCSFLFKLICLLLYKRWTYTCRIMLTQETNQMF